MRKLPRATVAGTDVVGVLAEPMYLGYCEDFVAFTVPLVLLGVFCSYPELVSLVQIKDDFTRTFLKDLADILHEGVFLL